MGWWDKKLGPPVAPRPSPYAPIVPRGLGQDQDRAVGDYMQRAGIYQAPPPEQLQQPQFNLGDPNGEIPAGDAMRVWQGKEGAQETARTGNCPECGSHRYFSRVQGSVTNVHGQRVSPASECFECGYPHQQGNVDAVVKVVGATQNSRQGAMLPMGTLESLQKQ